MASYQIETQVTEINNKFKRLVHHLGNNNSSGITLRNGIPTRLPDINGNPTQPSERYKFEVEFAYILSDISLAPDYIIQKHVDRANMLVMELVALIKERGQEEEDGDIENV